METPPSSETHVVPRGLQYWFIIHFAIDILFALPMMIAPSIVLPALGWQTVDPLATRLVAAALFAIGIESLLCRKASAETFRTMLNLKIIWSSAAVIGLAVSLVIGRNGRPVFGWIIAGVFLAFNVLWVYWRLKVRER